MNSMELAKGGPFTRMDPATGEQSCLSLVICSADLKPHVESLVIDGERKYGMKRAIYKNGGFRLVYSDHYTIFLVLKNMKCNRGGSEKAVRWNLQKEGGVGKV